MENIKELFENDNFLKNTILNSMSDIIWIADFKNGKTKHSMRFFEIMGIEPGSLKTVDDVRKLLHPDDIEMTATYFNYENLKDNPTINISYRLQHSDGHYLWFEVRGTTTFTNDGNIYGFGSLSNITEHNKNEEELKLAIIRSLDENNFHLKFQPKINLTDFSIFGFEALARMNDSKLGRIQPNEFIPVAESANLIVQLGDSVIENAFKFLEKINSSVNISINVSPVQLDDPNFVDKVKKSLFSYKLLPEQVEFEITESVAIESVESVVKTLNKVRDLGVKISLDDFGTGYSTLTQLLKLPVDIVKIDKIFVDNICENEKEAQICRRIIEMAHSIGATVVAEGVETEEQYGLLKEIGCDFGQGYFFSRPISAEAAEKFIRRKRME